MEHPTLVTGKGKGSGGTTAEPCNKAAEYAGKKTVSTDCLVEFVCHQRSAILLDAMPNEDVENILIRGVRPAPDRESPLKEMALRKLYHGPNGEIGIRVEMLFACLRAAGRKVKVGKSLISTAKTTELPSILTIEDEFILLFDPDTGQPLTVEDCVPDLRRGMMDAGGKKTAVGIVRPRFNRWAFRVTVSVDYSGMEGLTEKHIYQLFEIAGRRIGLGSFRPTCNGPFGRFKIAEMNVVNG